MAVPFVLTKPDLGKIEAVTSKLLQPEPKPQPIPLNNFREINNKMTDFTPSFCYFLNSDLVNS
jgi:hypothetical protein